MTSNGYRLIRRKAGGWVLEHLNGDRVDDRPENLELWVTRQPRGQRVDDALAWAHETLARYGSVS